MRRGFNILEVVMATGLLAVIFLAVISLFLAFQGSDRYADALAQATDVGEGEMARLKTRSYEVLEGYVAAPLAVYSVERAGTTYNVTVTANRLDPTPSDPAYKLVRLRVRLDWLQRRSLDRQDEKQAAVREVATSTELLTVIAPEARL